jgi:hypothetical protein
MPDMAAARCHVASERQAAHASGPVHVRSRPVPVTESGLFTANNGALHQFFTEGGDAESPGDV